MKKSFLLAGMLVALLLITFAPMSIMAQPLPYSDQLDLNHDEDDASDTFPYFVDSTNDPIEIEFSGSYVHTNDEEGSFYASIQTTTSYDRGPYFERHQVVYPWPFLQEDSAQNSIYKLSWDEEPFGDGIASMTIVIDEVE
jgi:hypothetical protein